MPINIPHLDSRAECRFGQMEHFNFKVNDYIALIDQIAGVREQYLVEDVKIRITSILDQLLMKWISKGRKGYVQLQANSFDISKGIQEDLDMQMIKSGITITGFNVMSFSYPKEIQDMITKNASHGMVGDVDRYQQVSITDGMASGKMSSGGAASDMAGMVMGMNIAGKMMNQMNQPPNNQPSTSENTDTSLARADGQKRPNFCPNCGTKQEEPISALTVGKSLVNIGACALRP